VPHIFNTMGTTVSLICPEIVDASPQLEVVMAAFTAFDNRFSLYKNDSELSAIARGELKLASASPELRDVYARALEWRSATGGAFTPHRPDGIIDLNGIVKALAMQSCADVLISFGMTEWCLNVGGDIVTSGQTAEGDAWTVGITDPHNRAALLCAITLTPQHPAVATSGIAERGAHIWAAGDSPYAQVTVVAETIEVADVVATAIFAGGPTALNCLVQNNAIDVLTIDAKGNLLATPGFTAALT
jgi:thiamine biosynthesis lipoprotein